MQRLLILTSSLLLLSSPVFCQKNTELYKFGDIKPEDFAPTVYSIDSSANAVILSDIGVSKFEGNNAGDFSVVFNHRRRIRLMNKNGFDAATIQIQLYTNGTTEERLEKLEAVTYNLENGKVIATPLDKNSIFKDVYDKNHTQRKFTFPNIKEGSIIEYAYTITSPFYFNLQPWNFQGHLPRLWSDYQVTIPNDILTYVLLRHGYLPYAVDTSYTSSEVYNILERGDAQTASQVFQIRSATVTARWAMKDVPPLKDESYITTLDNYNAKIEFQLQRIKYSETDVVNFMGDWNQLVDRMMKRDDFGVPITDNNGWLKDELKNITKGETTDLGKAKQAYAFLRDNFTCSTTEGVLTTKPLKKTYQDKNGSVGDINLLLVAVLKKLGLDANPVILSTRDNGRMDEVYPLIDQYNYVIARVNIDTSYYLLDATNKVAGFGKLSSELYNGSARTIATLPALVPLSPDSIRESKVTSVFLTNDSTGKGLTANFYTQYGTQEGMDMREKFAKQKPEDYFKELKKSYSFETEISNTEIDSLKMPDEPLSIKYNFTFNTNDDDIIYFSPLLAESYKENPFKSANRLYPVEMPYCPQETYILNMEVPTGYNVEELPKSTRVKLNGAEGMFEYIIQQTGNRIQLRCRTVLNQANFDPDDYQTLRDFFAFIVKKEAEQIVFKKAK